MDRGNGMPVGMMSSGMTAGGGFLGLDMSIQHHPYHHHQRGHQQQQQLHHPPPQQHMIPFQTPPPGGDGDRQSQHPMRHGSYVLPFGALSAKQQPAMSSEEDSGFGDVELDVDARRGAVTQLPPSSQQSAPSPWQRMKWTDGMVRLLISVVYHVGDDVGGGADGEQQQQPPPAPHGPGAKGKKAATSALLQKKGKWKSVSQAMMEKGFYVSPQQCEDKFNDLNKRYKRVNDLLGKGTACRVVENQALLETLDHLSPKAKEEARKLLNSKHLFFPEMCRYHNAGLSSCNSQPPPQAQQPAHAEQQQQCLHHPAGQMGDVRMKGSGSGGGVGGMLEDEGIMAEEDDEDEDEDVESADEDDYDDDDELEDDDELNDNRAHHRQRHHQNRHGEGEEDEDSKLGAAKRLRRTPSQQQFIMSSASASPPLSLSLSSPAFTSMQQLKSELVAVAAGGGEQQQKQWLRKRSAELEEQRVVYQSRALQLEQQRFKWLRYSSIKEREMEQRKLDIDRRRLENDRMLLLLRQKEIEIVAGSRTGDAAEKQQQLHYSAANSGRPAPDDQPSGTATS